MFFRCQTCQPDLTWPRIGGLLNATFGNAVEMIVTVNAIKAGLVTVVQGSLLGVAPRRQRERERETERTRPGKMFVECVLHCPWMTFNHL